MSETSEPVRVENNEEENRFEVKAGGDVAYVEYDRDGDQIYFTHTEVPQAFEGKGIGKALATTALDFARSEKLEVIPRCPFVASYIRKHPEYLDLVPESSRSLVG